MILSSWLLTRLDTCACCAAEVLCVFNTLAAVCWHSHMLIASRVWSFCTYARVAFFCYCDCSSGACRPWISKLRWVGLWLCAGALCLQRDAWNRSGTLWIMAAGLLSVDAATVVYRGERGSTCKAHVRDLHNNSRNLYSNYIRTHMLTKWADHVPGICGWGVRIGLKELGIRKCVSSGLGSCMFTIPCISINFYCSAFMGCNWIAWGSAPAS